MKENKVVFLSNSMSQKLLSNWNCNGIIGLLQEEKAKPLLYKVQMSKTRVKITQKQSPYTR